MKVGILGKKIGMTQLFTEEGGIVPVTVIEAGPCTVLKVMKDKMLLGFGDRKEKNVTKPEMGFYKKINLKPKAFVKEIPFESNNGFTVGQEIKTDIFKENDYVDVTGTSVGKGFQGVVKRYHFKGGPGSHGSMFHRAPGGIGSRAGGGGCRKGVRRGKKFPGRMGNERSTVQNLAVVKVFADKNILMLSGPVPGPCNGYLEIRSSVKGKIYKKQGSVSDKKGEQAKDQKKAQVKK